MSPLATWTTWSPPTNGTLVFDVHSSKLGISGRWCGRSRPAICVEHSMVPKPSRPAADAGQDGGVATGMYNRARHIELALLPNWRRRRKPANPRRRRKPAWITSPCYRAGAPSWRRGVKAAKANSVENSSSAGWITRLLYLFCTPHAHTPYTDTPHIHTLQTQTPYTHHSITHTIHTHTPPPTPPPPTPTLRALPPPIQSRPPATNPA